ncbi:MAG TPA: hypothetical protein PLI13_03215, partial [Paracoccus sp. (in: a-proteobacteria)]|nr:hypothetical protein [Paracoccus sp. (in: a-proteobacteria)]
QRGDAGIGQRIGIAHQPVAAEFEECRMIGGVGMGISGVIARVLGALQSAAEANPSLIGGAGSAPAAEATDETPAADAATEAAPAAE